MLRGFFAAVLAAVFACAPAGAYLLDVTPTVTVISGTFNPPNEPTVDLTGQPMTFRLMLSDCSLTCSPDPFPDDYIGSIQPWDVLYARFFISGAARLDDYGRFDALGFPGTARITATGLLLDYIGNDGGRNRVGRVRIEADRSGSAFFNWRGRVSYVGQYWDVDSFDTFALSAVFATPVPEPAAWAMMISGLALSGISARRRRSERANASTPLFESGQPRPA